VVLVLSHRNRGRFICIQQSMLKDCIAYMSLAPIPHSQSPWSNVVRTAYQKLHQIYHTGSSYIHSGSLKAHRLQQYRQAIIVDAYPLLLLLMETAESETLPLEWIEDVASEFTALLALINERWISTEREYVERIMAGINFKFRFTDQLMSLFCNPLIQHTLEIVANLGRTLIPSFFMKLFKREDRFLQRFLQAFWVLIEKLSKHGKMSWV